MTRPTRPPHDGVVSNRNTFQAARQVLEMKGIQHLHTAAGTPFTAEAHIPSKGDHIGQDCIWIKNNDGSVAYIFHDCWGHVTNYAGVYIDSYTPIL
jgi:hypothetical protein